MYASENTIYTRALVCACVRVSARGRAIISHSKLSRQTTTTNAAAITNTRYASYSHQNDLFGSFLKKGKKGGKFHWWYLPFIFFRVTLHSTSLGMYTLYSWKKTRISRLNRILGVINALFHCVHSTWTYTMLYTIIISHCVMMSS